MNKTFFLGLGGQKCGSSWIQAQLASATGSDFGRLGEYQVWEHHLGGVFARYKVPAPSGLDRLRVGVKRAVGASEPAAHLRWRLQSDPNAYFDYFAALLDQKGITRTGDITPSYAALPADMLGMISYGFAERGIKTKAIFSMRDPVARLKSQYRMYVQKGYKPAPDDLDSALLNFAKTEDAKARCGYAETLANIADVFDDSDQHICLFEELFTETGIHALSEFSGTRLDPAAGATMVNARSGGAQVKSTTAKTIAQSMAREYEAVANLFPQVFDLWNMPDTIAKERA